MRAHFRSTLSAYLQSMGTILYIASARTDTAKLSACSSRAWRFTVGRSGTPEQRHLEGPDVERDPQGGHRWTRLRLADRRHLWLALAQVAHTIWCLPPQAEGSRVRGSRPNALLRHLSLLDRRAGPIPQTAGNPLKHHFLGGGITALWENRDSPLRNAQCVCRFAEAVQQHHLSLLRHSAPRRCVEL